MKVKLDNYTLEVYKNFKFDPSIHLNDISFDKLGLNLYDDNYLYNWNMVLVGVGRNYKDKIKAMYTLFGSECNIKDKTGKYLNIEEIIDHI